MLTLERARELVDYDHETGIFRWRVSRQRVSVGSIAGSIDRQGYRRMSVDGYFCRAHRLAWFYVYGEWPPRHIDHIDGNRDNNAIANLRLASDQQNAVNRCAPTTNKSGVKGVYFRHGKWDARIKVRGKNYQLGRFATKEEAAVAYQAAAVSMHGSYARSHASSVKTSQAIASGDEGGDR